MDGWLDGSNGGELVRIDWSLIKRISLVLSGLARTGGRLTHSCTLPLLLQLRICNSVYRRLPRCFFSQFCRTSPSSTVAHLKTSSPCCALPFLLSLHISPISDARPAARPSFTPSTSYNALHKDLSPAVISFWPLQGAGIFHGEPLAAFVRITLVFLQS